MRPLLLIPLISVLGAAEPDTRLVRETAALTPEVERAALHVPPGFEVQLFASEPQINKPINIAFDARGRLWVSSTVEYPYAADKARWSDPQGTHVKGSRDAIKILEDTDGDGRADKVTDFANELNIPTGVLPWHKPEHKAGCIAWSIPNIWYFADTNGDDIADHREILFGPLGYEKDTHGMCSSFRLGLDGWVYATHGFNNTSTFRIRSDRSVGSDRSQPLELHSGNVFRFRPDGSAVEKFTSGQVNPFGLAWDRYGNLYSADCHSSPIYQLIRGAHYPSFGKPHDGLGFAPVMCQHTHGSTGICGIVYIDGGVWGPEWDDHTFVGNVVTSKVNHDHVTFTGSTPKANERPDFLTSDDPWFRPVDLQLGPDNALYIADFYNKIIGHYEVPLEHPGRDKERGRIWRVVKHGSSDIGLANWRPIENVKPDNLEDKSLQRRHLALQTMKEEHPDAAFFLAPPRYFTGLMRADWWMLDMHRRRGLRKPVSSYSWDAILSNPKTDVPEQDMVEALHQAEEFGLDSIGKKAIHVALKHASPRVRLAALGAMRAHPDTSHLPHVIAIWQKVEAGDLVLEHAARLTLRDHLALPKAFSWLTEVEATTLGSIARAVPTTDAAAFLLRRLQNAAPITPAILAHIARHGDPLLLPQAIALAKQSSLLNSTTPLPLLTALHDGLAERGTPPPPELLSWAQELATQLLDSTAKQPTPAWTTLGDAKWSLQPRQLADDTETTVLQSILKGGGDEESRTGALKSQTFPAPAKLALWINGHRGFPATKAHDKNLVRITDAETGREFARAFPPRQDKAQRTELDLTAHTGKPVRLEVIDGDDGKAYAWLGITRIEPAVVSVNDFQSADTTRESLKTIATMLQHSAPAALREKLATYLPPRPAPPTLPVSPEQRKQLDTLIAARVAAFAKAKPDLETGANVFKMNCAACHQIKGEGGLIGPQLDGIGARGPSRLCEDILDPNRNVDAHFHLHTLTLKDSSTFAGFLKAELGQIHLLADATGKEHRIAKKDIAKTEVSPISLMPPTFGQTMDEATFNDLLGYLLNEKVGK